jgi:hypothetical protein
LDGLAGGTVRARNGPKGKLVEIEQTTEQQLLTESKKHTKALENLNVLAQVWSVLAAIGLVVLLIALYMSAQA